LEKLIKSCKNKDRKAQREMVDQLAPYLFGICRRYAAQAEDARDLLQDAFIRIFNHIDQCQTNEYAFRSWCKTITVNVALSKLRKKGLGNKVEINDFVCGVAAPKVYGKINAHDILKLLEKLPEKQKLVFNLSVLDGYSHKEIAEMLGIGESSSRTFLVRARGRLQKLIQAQEINVTNGK